MTGVPNLDAELDAAAPLIDAEMDRITGELSSVTGIDFDVARAPAELRVTAWFGTIDFLRQARTVIDAVRRGITVIETAFRSSDLSAQAVTLSRGQYQETIKATLDDLTTSLRNTRFDGEEVAEGLFDLTDSLAICVMRSLDSMSTGVHVDELTGLQMSADAAISAMREVAGWIKQGEFEATVKASTQRRVASDQIASSFLRQAAEETFSANSFRFAALAVATASFGVAAFFAFKDLDASLASHAGRTLTALPLLLIAAYLASESRDHRAIARRAQYWAVLLQTMDPFTAELPVADRRVVVLQTASALFRSPTDPGDAGPAALGMDVLPQLTTLIQTLRGPGT